MVQPVYDITTHIIAQSRVNKDDMRAWLDSLGATEWPWDAPGIDDEGNEITDADVISGNTARSCYKSFGTELNPNITRTRKLWKEYFDNVLRSKHGSVLEHVTWTVAIEGCSRVFTAEMNRHRAGVAISEQSLRYIRFTPNTIRFWVPRALRTEPHEADQYAADTLLDMIRISSEQHVQASLQKWVDSYLSECDPESELDQRKRLSLNVMARAFQSTAQAYLALESIWSDQLSPSSPFKGKKAITSMMRRIIPMGVCTGSVYTVNIRAMRHIAAMRCSPSAEEEIADVIGSIMVRLAAEEPNLFGDFDRTDDGFWVPKYEKV